VGDLLADHALLPATNAEVPTISLGIAKHRP